jgi:hypothetical protein
MGSTFHYSLKSKVLLESVPQAVKMLVRAAPRPGFSGPPERPRMATVGRQRGEAAYRQSAAIRRYLLRPPPAVS